MRIVKVSGVDYESFSYWYNIFSCIGSCFWR
jgi:hypothetical protein